MARCRARKMINNVGGLYQLAFAPSVIKSLILHAASFFACSVARQLSPYTSRRERCLLLRQLVAASTATGTLLSGCFRLRDGYRTDRDYYDFVFLDARWDYSLWSR